MSGVRTAVVTGAARGIGRALIQRFLRTGHNVVAIDVDAEALSETWLESDQLTVQVADVASIESVEAAISGAVSRFGRIDIVINNAGLHAKAWNQLCTEMTTESWQRLFAVNVLGPLNVCRSAAPHLAANNGVVVNVSSNIAYSFEPPSAYAVSKAALSALTTCLAAELGPQGISVVAIAPGLVGTEAVLSGLSAERLSYYRDRQAITELVQPDDMAALIETLAGDSARLLTGHTVLADCGFVRGH